MLLYIYTDILLIYQQASIVNSGERCTDIQMYRCTDVQSRITLKI